MQDADVKVLENYRQAVQMKKGLQEVIDIAGTTGAPAKLRVIKLSDAPRGTNDPAASASQRIDYLEEQMQKWDEQAQKLHDRFEEIAASIKDMRQQSAVRLYYGAGQTYENAAKYMSCSPKTVARLCRQALAH